MRKTLMTETFLPEPCSYEQAQARLEEIAALLDHPEVPLAEALALCAEAATLIRRCRELLTEAEGKLEQLVEAAGGGVRIERME
jgi:exodeoxyribonuclease VII small subunit